ncbi:MAG: hypothetical protein HQK65_23245 [Desulfamplus sp.]|nr:hypothetical protein [Desulfamplus sp.]
MERDILTSNHLPFFKKRDHRAFIRLILFMFVLLSCKPAIAGWNGNYLSVSQAGLAVQLTLQNEYLLYIVQDDNQAIHVDVGTFQTYDGLIRFTSSHNYSVTEAVINQQNCSFTWGEAGEFRSSEAYCSNTAPEAINIQNYVSKLSLNSLVMNIPQLGIPDGYGGINVLNINLQLAAANPLQFVMTAADYVYSPANVISAAYLPDMGVLYIPVVQLIDETTGHGLEVYEVVLTLTAYDPHIVFTEYAEQEIQYQQPTQPYTQEYNPGMYGIMSDINSMYHDTSMHIINNMGAGSGYDYDYY